MPDSMGRGWADVLAEIPLFAGLSKRHLNKIAALAKTRPVCALQPDRAARRPCRQLLRHPRRRGAREAAEQARRCG